MSWFKRLKEGIQTATRNKKEAPEGLWYKCDRCKETSTVKELRENFHKCPKCNYHTRIGSDNYFELIFDGEYQLLHEELKSKDALSFEDIKTYPQRLEEAYKKNSVSDAITVGFGKIEENSLVIACMDFSFIGGSMGSVVGERISRAIDSAISNHCPLLIISKSGGARMMESAYSLMQMAKTSAVLSELAEHKLPFISVITDPTTGGVSASYAMLGDLIIAEPKALIGFAGPRVVEQTIRKKLPEGFQRSEFLLEHGFLDMIVHRKDMRETLHSVLSMLMDKS